MPKVRKIRGEYPIDTVVNTEVVSFDANGEAEVSDEVAEVLAQIDFEYVVLEPVAESTSEDEDDEDEDTDGDGIPDTPAPKKPAPKKPAPKK